MSAAAFAWVLISGQTYLQHLNNRSNGRGVPKSNRRGSSRTAVCVFIARQSHVHRDDGCTAPELQQIVCHDLRKHIISSCRANRLLRVHRKIGFFSKTVHTFSRWSGRFRFYKVVYHMCFQILSLMYCSVFDLVFDRQSCSGGTL